jgi:gamma-glutamylcyclotransferase (GGCT)/AIG2-like uncharacterized protein YtfP
MSSPDFTSPQPATGSTLQLPIAVFVYGTLKPGGFYFSQYCEGRVVECCEAIAQGDLFDLPIGYPAMTAGNGWVQGYVLTFNDPTVLIELDELEGYDPSCPATENEYQRQEIDVFDRQQRPLGRAWVYMMLLARVQQSGGVWLPGGEWSSHVCAC